MKKQDIINNNKLIAKFMDGYDHGDAFNFGEDNNKYNLPQWADYDELYYNSSWEWLMPVVDKISNIVKNDGRAFLHLVIYSPSLFEGRLLSCMKFPITKEYVWKDVIKFIKWYNETTNKD